jgi:uncharacterized protein
MSDLIKIKRILDQLKPELIEKYHINSIGLFGSIVRDDFTTSSDIDIIVDFSQPIGIEFIDLADHIEKNLKRRIDLVSKKGIRREYLKSIESEIGLYLELVTYELSSTFKAYYANAIVCAFPMQNHANV